MQRASFDVPALGGRPASLEPLAPQHEADLVEAVAENDLYKVWFTRLPSPDGMGAEIEDRLAEHTAGRIVPWTIRRVADDRAVGMTTFLNIRPDHRRLEIGSTSRKSSHDEPRPPCPWREVTPLRCARSRLQQRPSSPASSRA